MSVQAPAHSKLGSTALTQGYRVTAAPRYLRNKSDPAARQYVFAYRIRIVNETGVPARLLNRAWRIVDALGREEEVRGEGVVGAQPNLAAGEVFEYESFCPLRTPWGTMEGAYTLRTEDGETFDISIARFFLVCEE